MLACSLAGRTFLPEIVIEKVRLEGGFKREGRIRVAECLRQTVKFQTDGPA